MIRKISYILLIIICFLNINAEIAFSYYDKITHPAITEEAVNRSELESFIKEVLNYDDGIEQKFTNNGPNQLKNDDITKNILQWLQFGSTYEDVYMRASNHFYDPTRNLGLFDETYPPSIFAFFWPFEVVDYEGISNKDWALGYFEDTDGKIKYWDMCGHGADKFTSKNCNDYSYRKVKEAYLEALVFCNNEEEQNTKFAIMFERLGRVMHLLEDMGVPAHVRNDMKGHLQHASSGFSLDWYDKWWFQLPKSLSGLGNIYEYWVDEKIKKIEKTGQNYVKELCEHKQIIVSEPFPKPEEYWDKEVYHNSTTEFDDKIMTAGLAEYTNANYLSRYAMFTENKDKDDRKYFPFPRMESVGVKLPKWKRITAEDGQYDNVLHLTKSKDGEIFLNEPFAKYSYLWNPVNVREAELAPEAFNAVGRLCFILDDEVHEAYAKRLLPKTVEYSAGLLNHFFRGRLEITKAVPVIRNNNVKYMMLKVKNITSTEESLTGGYIIISCRYTPDNGNPDGSDDIFVQSYSYPCDSLDFNKEQWMFITLRDLIPEANAASIKAISLAYNGKLGEEENAVIGTILPLFDDQARRNFGKILLIEEWKNAPAGDNQWTHANTMADQGECSSIVENDLLTKENIRYAGQDIDPWNTSKYKPAAPILITPESYIQFKVDNMTVSHDIEASQYIDLKFSNGTGLFFTHNEGKLFSSAWTGYYKFPLGLIIMDNIYDLLKRAEITTPEPPEKLYLEEVAFIQMMWPTNSPTEVQHEQYMTSDFIQIIEGIHK